MKDNQSKIQLRKITRFSRLLLSQDGGFKKNFVSTFSAKIFIALLGFLVTPILSRLYTPTDYGVFAIYSSITINFSIICTLGYTDALGVSNKDSDFFALLKFSILSTFLFALGSLPFLPYLVDWFDQENLIRSTEMWIIWAGLFLVPISAALLRSNIHYNDFGFAAKQGTLTHLLVMRPTALLGGFYSSMLPFGLLFSELFGKVALIASTVLRFRSELVSNWKKTDLQEIRRVLREFISYPKFFLPSRYLGLLLSQIPIFFVARSYGLEELGQFSMATSLVFLPVNLIGNSMNSVYLRRFRESPPQEITTLTNQLFVVVTVIMLIPVLILIVFGPTLITFFLGNNWDQAGLLIQIMSVFLIHEILFMTINGLFQILKKEKEFLITQIIGVSVSIVYAFIGHHLDITFLHFIIGFSLIKLVFMTGNLHFLLFLIDSRSSLRIGIWIIATIAIITLLITQVSVNQ